MQSFLLSIELASFSLDCLDLLLCLLDVLRILCHLFLVVCPLLQVAGEFLALQRILPVDGVGLGIVETELVVHFAWREIDDDHLFALLAVLLVGKVEFLQCILRLLRCFGEHEQEDRAGIDGIDDDFREFRISALDAVKVHPARGQRGGLDFLLESLHCLNVLPAVADEYVVFRLIVHVLSDSRFNRIRLV